MQLKATECSTQRPNVMPIIIIALLVHYLAHASVQATVSSLQRLTIPITPPAIPLASLFKICSYV